LDDEVVLSTSKGTVIRQAVKDIPLQQRLTTGVMIQNIQKDDSIIMVRFSLFFSLPATQSSF